MNTFSDILAGWLVASVPLACLIGAWFASADKNVGHDHRGDAAVADYERHGTPPTSLNGVPCPSSTSSPVTRPAAKTDTWSPVRLHRSTYVK